MARNVAADTLAVGNALASVRIDQMILNLAKGIAWGQYDPDKVGVDITKMMGVPGTVTIGGDAISMLEAGFIPSFYHFVDTILELKMEVNIREEVATSVSAKMSVSRKSEVTTGGELEMKTGASASIPYLFSANMEMRAKANWETKSTSAYSRSVDASHSQKFSQDLSASSLMRTKLVPVPPPEVLVERIKILLEKLQQESEDEAEAQILFRIDVTDALIPSLNKGGSPSDDLKAAFSTNSIALTGNASVTSITDGTRWR